MVREGWTFRSGLVFRVVRRRQVRRLDLFEMTDREIESSLGAKEPEELVRWIQRIVGIVNDRLSEEE